MPAKAVLWASVVVAVSIFLIEHRFQMSRMEGLAFSLEEVHDAVSAGTFARQTGCLILAMFGLSQLLRGHRPLSVQPVLASIMCALFLWASASLLWSTDFGLTIRRLFVLACCTLAALGISRQFTIRELCWLIIAVSSAYIVLGVVTEIALSTFQPFSADYRFCGTLHPNAQGMSCACLCLACLAMPQVDRRQRWLLGALALVAIMFLLLTGSRTSTAGLAISLLAVALLRFPRRRLLIVGCWTISAAAAALLLAQLLQFDLFPSLSRVALLGRTEEAEGLVGRVPLWIELTSYVRQRPLLGFGYGAFWSPEHIEDLGAELSWIMSTAHNGFLELALNLGLVGASLAVAAALTATVRAVRGCLDAPDRGYEFIFALLVLGLTVSALESAFVMPSMCTLLAGSAVCQMAFFPIPETAIAEVQDDAA